MSASDRDQREAFIQGLEKYNSQRKWYSMRSGEHKTRAQRLDMFVILCGALIAAVPIFKPGGAAHWTGILVSFLGAAVVVGQGAARVFRYSDTWTEYRLASERMKREERLFLYATAPYDGDLEAAQERLKAEFEQIISEEQKIFFENVTSQKDQGGE